MKNKTAGIKKKIIVVLTVTAIIILANLASDAVRHIKRDGDYKYRILEDGTVEIKEYLKRPTEIDIPEELGGRTVTRIGRNSFERTRGNTHTTINIPSTVTTIGSYAFEYCTGLTITGCEGVETIEGYAFWGCSFYEDDSLPEFPSLVTLEDHAFSGTYNPGLFKIPGTLEYISDYALANSNLKLEGIPDTVRHIGIGGVRAYAYSRKDYAVVGDGFLVNISYAYDTAIIPSGARVISSTISTYSDCDIYVPDTVTDILEGVLYPGGNVRVYLPPSVTCIGSGDPENAGDISQYPEYLTLVVEEGSYGEAYARAKGIGYETVESVAELYDKAVKDQRVKFAQEFECSLSDGNFQNGDGKAYMAVKGTGIDGVEYETLIEIDTLTNEKTEIYTARRDYDSGETVKVIVGYRDDTVYYMDSDYGIYAVKPGKSEPQKLTTIKYAKEATFTFDETGITVEYKRYEDEAEPKSVTISLEKP